VTTNAVDMGWSNAETRVTSLDPDAFSDVKNSSAATTITVLTRYDEIEMKVEAIHIHLF